MTLFGKHSPFEWAFLQLKALVSPAAPQSARGPATTLVVGHRGAQRKAAENTCRSAEVALAEGASGVEVDVCVTRDGHAVLWHDRDPDHWTALARQNGLEPGAYVPRVPSLGSNARKPVTALSLSEFLGHYGYRTADSVPGDGLPRDAAPNTLASLAHCLAQDERARVIMLDVKLSAQEAGLAPALLDSLAVLLRNFPRLRQRRLQLLCPEREVYRVLAHSLRENAALGSVRLSADFELPGVVDEARELGATDISIGITTRLIWPSVREEILEAVRARNQGQWRTVTVWTANREEELLDLFRVGVDAVLTDDIPLALSVAGACRDSRGQFTT